MAECERWVDRAIRTQLDRSSLTAERERHLLRLARDESNAEARQTALTELWESHSKLVVAIANRYRRFNIELLDLIGAGHLGLHAAIARFELDRFETRLSTYATGWIRWYIQDYIRRNKGPVRLPESTGHRQLAQMGDRLVADARKACMRERVEATDTEICERISRRIGLPADEVARSLRTINGATLSLHAQDGDDDGPSLADTLADDSACSESDVILRLDYAKARKRVLALADEILGERERTVFLARCMIDTDEMVHLESLAGRFGVSRERVYQLEASAKRKIATALTREGYGDLAADGEAIRLPPARARRRTSQPTPQEDTPRHVTTVAG